MERYTAVGKAVMVGDAVQVSDKFLKRELRIEMGDKYPQIVVFEFVQGWADILDNVTVGDIVEVDFNLRGREYKDRCYNTLNGYALRAEGKTIPFNEKKKEKDEAPF